MEMDNRVWSNLTTRADELVLVFTNKTSVYGVLTALILFKLKKLRERADKSQV